MLLISIGFIIGFIIGWLISKYIGYKPSVFGHAQNTFIIAIFAICGACLGIGFEMPSFWNGTPIFQSIFNLNN